MNKPEICKGATVRFKKIPGYTPDIKELGHISAYGFYEDGQGGTPGTYWFVAFPGQNKDLLVNAQYLELVGGGHIWVEAKKEKVPGGFFLVPGHWENVK